MRRPAPPRCVSKSGLAFVATLGGALSIAAGHAEADARNAPPSRVAPTRPVKKSSSDEVVVTLRAAATDRVRVRGGVFVMGSDDAEVANALALCQTEPLGEGCRVEAFEDELVPHHVRVSDFVIGRREVTVAEHRRCVEAGPCAAPPLAAGGKRFDVPDYPVTMVTWNDAVTYCTWAGGRLPTEAEWERAARGLSGRRFPWGNVYNPFLLNGGRFASDSFDDRDGFAELAPVGSFPSGRTPDGIDDLAGNVEEWVSDYFAPYPEADIENPTGPDSGDEKVLRGGSFGHAKAWQRGANRNHDLASARRYWRGFRCVWPVAASP